jgi:hypothetical protein
MLALIHDLKENGAYSRRDERYLSLRNIGEGLKNLFGQDVAEMIMERVIL